MKVSRVFNVLMALFLIAAAMANAQPAAAQRGMAQSASDIAPDALFVPGELIVTFTEGASASAYQAQASALAGEVSAEVVGLGGNLALLSFAEDADVAALSVLLAENPDVEGVTPNYVGYIPELNMKSTGAAAGAPRSGDRTMRVDRNGNVKQIDKAAFSNMRTIRNARNVPTYPIEWNIADTDGFDYINAQIIWPNVALGAQVCIIDSGVDINHPDLKAKVLNGYDFVNNDLVANDDLGHGTHVAGIIVASNANKTGMIGVSNGTALAVKAINSDGRGTTWDLIESIRFCANKLTVRVINISLGGYAPTGPLYSALYYAIVTKAKFIVAAAGNESTSDLDAVNAFPGAWASSKVCPLIQAGPPATYYSASGACGGTPNGVHQGMLSVGAGFLWHDWNGYDLPNPGGNDQYWVDKDNGSPGIPLDVDALEEFSYPSCLANFSNYGVWVEMVAPGDDIFSTLPVSNYYTESGTYYEDSSPYQPTPGYGWASGTSMAAPFVSGAVARMLSVYPTTTNITNPSIQSRMTDNSRDLTDSLAVDTGVTAGDAVIGYASTSHSGEIPYCIPTLGGSYTLKESMANSKYLDVAAIMGRTAIQVFLRDATNGLPLTGAKVDVWQGAVLKNSTVIGNFFTATPAVDLSMTELINLPTTMPALTTCPLPTVSTGCLTVKVTKAGYTTNAVIAALDPTAIWNYYTDEYLTVSVPPLGKISLVADWDYSNQFGNIDLDLFTYTPDPVNPDVIGNSAGTNLFAHGSGSVVEGNMYLPTGPNVPQYRTRWYHDGGNSTLNNGIGTEAVSMMPWPALPLNPWFNNPATSLNKYEFFLTDYGAGGDDMYGNAGPVVVRLWRSGLPAAGKVGGTLDTTLPYAYSMFHGDGSLVCNSDGANDLPLPLLVPGTAADNADNEWLKIGNIVGNTFFIDDTCVVGDPIVGGNHVGGVGDGLPYRVFNNSSGTTK